MPRLAEINANTVAGFAGSDGQSRRIGGELRGKKRRGDKGGRGGFYRRLGVGEGLGFRGRCGIGRLGRAPCWGGTPDRRSAMTRGPRVSVRSVRERVPIRGWCPGGSWADLESGLESVPAAFYSFSISFLLFLF
jgi:hypothetical protein